MRLCDSQLFRHLDVQISRLGRNWGRLVYVTSHTVKVQSGPMILLDESDDVLPLQPIKTPESVSVTAMM